MRRAIWLCPVLLVLGCVTTKLSPEAEVVRLTSNPEVVRECRFLREIAGISTNRQDGGSPILREAAARASLRNNAVAIGADVVLVAGAMAVGAVVSTQRGEAYRCAPPAPPTPNTTTERNR